MVLAFLVAVPAAAQDKLPPPRAANGLALTPPMGWNSWNKFACNVDEALIRRTADSIVSSGMRDAGYTYVVIDDCWHGQRDAHGDIQPDPKRFPSGMKALGDYIHSKGLKFGIYSDAGAHTCGGRPGSQGHEYQDAAQYAAWGVDYLKYDWCETFTRDAREAYTTMSDALRATGRPIVLSMCEWGHSKPWLWAQGTGNLWRTTGDIWDSWDRNDPAHSWAHPVTDILDRNADLHPYAGPGGWNDPDMLEVGNGGMSDDEYRAHFALWAMLAAPLMAGNDIAGMSPATHAILTNAEIIAIDQDPLGRQARRVWKQGDLEIWARPLADGSRAVALLNRGPAPASIRVDWLQLAYPAATRASVRDLWAHRDLGRMTGGYETQVRSHAAVVLKVMP
ncbi:MAG: glycoside hydrolase family 27 protein [Sphingomonas sp.]|nr:glycoside hydrolase family 27 protein [Sphingomonas sp.]